MLPKSLTNSVLNTLEHEFRPMLRLAAPLIAAELGWVAMGVVDTIMVARLPDSAEAIGATSLGGVLFYAISICGAGMLLGLDTVVAQAFGAGDLRECHRSFIHGVFLALGMTPVLMLLVWLLEYLVGLSSISSSLRSLTSDFMGAIVWSTLPLLFYFAFRRYLQAMDHVVPVMFALVTANLVNAALNWILIFGHLGAPAMGVAGSGWSTVFARIYMAGVLLAYIVYNDRRLKVRLAHSSLRLHWQKIRELVKLGAPAATQIGLEVGVFAAATYLAGRLGAVPLAAHQIALSAASVTFMVPLGISSAAAVRVGQELGRGDPFSAGRAGWTALFFGVAFMSAAAAVFAIFPRQIAQVFTYDDQVIRLGIRLLWVAAAFQLFDGLQVVGTGALRGAGDTRTPMLVNAVGHWLIGLPLAWFFGFILGWGVMGIWAGLAAALMSVGTMLLLWWRRTVRKRMQRQPGPQALSLNPGTEY